MTLSRRRAALVGRCLACLLLTLSATPTAARARTGPRLRDEPLTGVVTNASGAPLADATVLVVELDRAVRTDDRGRFDFASLPAGRYTLEIRRVGYRTRILPLEVPAAGPLEIALEEAAFPLDPLTVTVSRTPLAPKDSPLPVSVLGRPELDRDRSVSLARTLERVPGVRNLSTGQEIGKPVIRGLSGARVLVLSQGLRLEDYSWSDEDGPAVDVAMADRVEVVRGPASVIYGADAVGGVINVVPRSLPDAAGGAGFVQGDGELSVASNNREVGVIGRVEGATGGWGWRAMMNGRIAEALHTPLGELENTGFGAANAEAALVRRGDWGSVTARFVHNGGEFKLLEEDAPAGAEEGEEEGPERKLQDQRLQLLGTFPLGASARLETRIQLQRHNIIELEDDPDSLAQGILVEVPIFDLTLNTGLGEVLLHHSLGSDVSGTVGVSGEIQGSTTDGVLPVIPGADARSGALFLLERFQRGGLTVQAGLRGDLKEVDADARPSRAFEAVTWSAGAAWNLLGDLTLSGNVGTAWRAPTLFELYASGPRLGEGRYEIGDATLDEERSLNLDAGLRFDGERVRGQLSVYRNDFEDFLFIQPTDREQDGYPVFEYRQAEALLTGGELSLEADATPWLTLSGRGDMVRGTNETRDEPLPLMPPLRVVAGAEVHGPWPVRDGWGYLGGEVEHVAEPDRLNPLDLSVDAYTLVHLRAGLRGRLLGRETALELRVRNAGNAEYRDFLSRYKAFALNAGRDVVLRLRMSF